MIIRARKPVSPGYTPARKVLKRCKQCHQVFIGNERHIYCSEACCTRYTQKNRRPQKRSKRSSGKIKPRGPFVCRYCDREYTTTRPKGEGEKYCSRKCSFNDLHINAAGLKFSRVYFRRCLYCNAPFVARNKKRTYCSDDCRHIDQKTKSRNKAIELHKSEGRVHRCTVCNTTYCLIYGAKQMKYCSDECFRLSDAYLNQKKQKAISRSYWNHKNRISSASYEYFSPFEIFDRDKWKCQACGIKTSKRLRGTYKDSAPELDHIVPLSKGGSHSKTNVRLSCRRCNIMKSNGSLNDQLLLIG